MPIDKQLPEEFWDDFDQIVSLLEATAAKLLARIMEAARPTIGMTDKEVGLRLNRFPADIRRFVFPYRNNGGDVMTGRTRDLFYKQFRPTSNMLSGYQPSSSISRVREETT